MSATVTAACKRPNAGQHSHQPGGRTPERVRECAMHSRMSPHGTARHGAETRGSRFFALKFMSSRQMGQELQVAARRGREGFLRGKAAARAVVYRGRGNEARRKCFSEATNEEI